MLACILERRDFTEGDAAILVFIPKRKQLSACVVISWRECAMAHIWTSTAGTVFQYLQQVSKLQSNAGGCHARLLGLTIQRP